MNVIDIRSNDGSIIKLEAHKFLPSVADLAREYAKQGYPDRYVVFSENQNATTATGNKAASDESEEGLFMSLILRPSLFASQASLLGAMSATAMVSALSEHTEKQLGLGWTTDLYCEGEKIGSVIIEGKLDKFTSFEYIIVTFCARLNKTNFPPRLTDMVRKVFESENTSIAMIMARSVLNRFFRFYASIKSSTKFMNTYLEYFVLRDTVVKYDTGTKKKNCKVIGVDSKTGELIIEYPKGETPHVKSQKSVPIPRKLKL